jgi:hypothetical protein
MIRETNTVLWGGFDAPRRTINIRTSGHFIEFSGGGDFQMIVRNELVTDDGRTVGERHRAELHAMLDHWLDGTWGDHD